MIFPTSFRLQIKFLLTLFFVFILHVSIWAQKKPKSTLLPANSNYIENVTYKIDDAGNRIKLDIYLPKTEKQEKFPVVVYVHGGAWVEGDKVITEDNYVEQTMLQLLEKNYAIVSVNYRLLNGNLHFPAPIQDIKDAVKWVRKNAEEYHFDPNNIGMWGVSAGAHLSLLNAYTLDSEFKGSPELQNYSSKVNYVVDNFGPVDINRLLHTRAPKAVLFLAGLISKKIIDLRGKLIKGMTGLDASNKKQVVAYCKTISPLFYSEDTVPTLILHGNKDKIAPIRHSKRLNQMLKKAGTLHHFVIVKKGNHGFYTTDPEYQKQLNQIMVDFIISQKK